MKAVILVVFSLFVNFSYASNDFTNSLGMTFKYISPGTFMMGSPESELQRDLAETQHQVTLTKAYYMGITEVTQGQWQAVMGSNPSFFTSCGSNCPVDSISWEEVQEFIANMNQRGEGIYRLPTEAEWEFAARAGSSTPFSFGDNISTTQVNYNGNYPYNGAVQETYRETPVAVGSLPANAWGLHEMHGNVWEWVQDWYNSYTPSAVTDPMGALAGDSRHIYRGGSWGNDAGRCRAATRYGLSPGLSNYDLGFRLVKTSSQIPSAPTVQVQATTGTSLTITPTDANVLTTSSSISDIGALLTLENSSTTIQKEDGSIIEIKQNTVVTLNPGNSINLIRGEVTTAVDCNYEVHTALVTITSCSTTIKGADAAKFTIDYSQSDLDGALKVTVETGSVDITDRSGVTHTVTAGNEKVIQGRVPRTQWILPIDEDKLYGGETNFLIWTQFPNTSSYQMEINLPSPDFSEQNVSVPEFTKQVIPLTGYVEYEGLVLFPLPLPEGANGLMLELRIFALDATGGIIGESVSSDSTKATVTDYPEHHEL